MQGIDRTPYTISQDSALKLVEFPVATNILQRDPCLSDCLIEWDLLFVVGRRHIHGNAVVSQSVFTGKRENHSHQCGRDDPFLTLEYTVKL